jgi:hypothetical protein
MSYGWQSQAKVARPSREAAKAGGHATNEQSSHRVELAKQACRGKIESSLTTEYPANGSSFLNHTQ